MRTERNNKYEKNDDDACSRPLLRNDNDGRTRVARGCTTGCCQVSEPERRIAEERGHADISKNKVAQYVEERLKEEVEILTIELRL